MRAAKNELAKRRAWLGVTALGVLAGSLALAGAPARRPVSDVKEAPAAPLRATDETNADAANSAAVETEPAVGMALESRDGDRPVRGGQMPAGQYPVIANVVVDYNDDDMSRARARGELIGPLPLPSEQGAVAAGGCTFSIECDDANPCTVDTCDLPDGSPVGTGKCEYDPVPNGSNSVFGNIPPVSTTCITTGTCGCDDDNYCNGYETCRGAVCAPGSLAKECNGGVNDDQRCVNTVPDCPGGTCVTRVGVTCDSHDDCRTPGVCNLGTGQCTSGDTGACATNDDCAIPGTGTCNSGVCTNGTVPSCCTNRDGCLPEFATCDQESENTGDPCDSDANCRGGRCSQCAELCANAADCADTSKCNGVESCTGLLCRGGTNNGNSCTTDANCPGDGKCLGTCVRGAAPCGYVADCEEGRCSGGVNVNKTCITDGNCPGSFCLLICMGGPNNGFPCGNTCPSGTCNPDTNLCDGGLNAGRGCAACGAGTCGAGPTCSKGRCCSAVAQPACTQLALGGNTPPALCVGNWYAGDGGNDLQNGVTEGLCGGANADGTVVFGCPKYSGGLTQTNINNVPQRLVTVGPVSDSPVCIPGPRGPGINGTGGNCLADPNGPAGKLNKLGDDYTLTDSSYIGLEVLRWVGGPITAADRILIEFYDGSNIFIEDIVMPGVTGTDVGIIVVQLNPALTIPPNGSVVARAATNFSPNTRFRWVSTSNPVAVGTNNANSLWVNNGPAANFLSPNPGTLAFELAGDKVSTPTGACCNARTGECTDGVLKWVCANQGNIFNGVSSACASCHAGPGPVGGHLGTCRECAAGSPSAGQACLSDTACGIQTQGTCNTGTHLCTAGHPPTTTCNVNDDCDKYYVCGPDNASCQPHPGGTVCSNNPNRLCPATPCDPPGTCGPPICVALAACASGACCNPSTGNCTQTSPGSCSGSTFQGFGTTCDADNGLGDAAQQHCCRQPALGMKCMGGPNNLDTCTVDANCRFCVGGPNDTDPCSVHTDCARCVGGTNNNGVCTDDDDCPGAGVCTGHCLGDCMTRGTGADNCADAFVHHITVPLPGADPVTISITGNNETASDTTENPDSCARNGTFLPTIEPGWWEAFEITDCAFVRVDYCCSTPVHEPVWAFLAQDCQCDNNVGTSPNPYHEGEASGFRGPPYCDEDNFWGSYGPLLAGTYYIPIYSALAGIHDDYVVHVTVEACLTAACCKPDGTCDDTLNQGECDTAGGMFLAPPQVATAQGICLPSTCTNGSCCLGPGECLDQESDLPGVADDDDPMTRAVCINPPFNGTWYGGVRCAGGECVGGGDAGESCRVASDCAAPGNCTGSSDELAVPSPCPLCEYTSNDTCDTGAGQYVWLSDTSSTNNPTRQANDIMPTETALLTTLCVKGVYLETIGPGVNCSRHATDGDVSDSFTVRLYAPDPTRYFPGQLLGEWATTHVTNRPNGFNAAGTVPCNTNIREGGFCYADYQLTLVPSGQYPLVTLNSGQIYFIEFSNNTSGGQADCDWWNLDAAIGQGNDYAFLDACGTTYTEDSVKLFVGDPNAMRDPRFCMNVEYVAPPSPVRACCTGDPITPCVESTIRECAVLAGDWQFEQFNCGGGFVCPVEPNDLCDKAPFVQEGEYEFNLFGATRDGSPTEQCEGPGVDNFGGDIWFFYQPTASGLAYIGTCDCERGGDEVVAVYHDGTTCHCPGDPELDLQECYDDSQTTDNWLEPATGCPYFGLASDVLINVIAGHCYTVRVATFEGTLPVRGNLRIALHDDECGNNQLESVKQCLGGPSAGASCVTTAQCGAGGTCVVIAGEQCDGTVTEASGSACAPADCAYNCLCPPPVCGKQCVGGAFDGQPCSTVADCPLGGTSCEGKLDAALGESCDTTAGAPGIAPCTFYSTTCRPPGDPDGECTCVPACGNGRREGGEICDGSDDANCGPGGSCTGLCRCNTVCGNGILEIGEQCDKGGPGNVPPAVDSFCTTRCQADCTCPTPSCGNNYTETASNDEECDGTDLAGESTCPGEQCRPPGDPAGECTCACAGGAPANVVTWDPTKSCIASGVNPSKACAVDADCGLCTLKICSGAPANTACTGTGQGTCPAGQTCRFIDCVTTAEHCTPLAAGTCTAGGAGTCVAWPNNSSLATTRDLRFTVTGEVGPSKLEAIKVTMVDLQHPRPANLAAQPPPNLTTYDTRPNAVCVGGTHAGHHCDTAADCPGAGSSCPSPVACTADPACANANACTLPSNSCSRWVGKLGTFYEAQGPPVAGPYKAARLQCTPYYWDWKPEGLINVVGADVAPSSEYSVQVFGVSCMGDEDGCTSVSAPTTMYTRRSGDVEQPFTPPGVTSQPDVTDIAQLVNKFKNLSGALVKAISQLQPNLPELNADINALDIVAVVDSVKGLKWAFSGPCACPSLVTCGATACPSGASVCVTTYGAGSTCVKTCSGPGPLAGDSCINNTHCTDSGTCGTPTCRDRCGRCKP